MKYIISHSVLDFHNISGKLKAERNFGGEAEMPKKYKDWLTGKHHTEQELLEIANKRLAHNYAPPDKVFVRGNGTKVYDIDGNEYYDLNACYSALPLGHKRGQLDIFPRAFHHPDRILFAKELAKFCGMDMVCPMNTGAEAVETAIKLARKWAYVVKKVPKNKAEIIVCENNFHGRTITIISASSHSQYKEFFGPHTPGFKFVPFGDIKALEKAITSNTAAFLVEPIQGEGGIIIPPKGYLSEAREICYDNHALFMLDEVQTGFGRTGDSFAHKHRLRLFPGLLDILILGKALGGGEDDISAVVANEPVMGLFEPGDHGSTFGGNPKACRSARKFLCDFKKFNLAKNSLYLGGYFLKMLREFARKRNSIKEVRGEGLFIAIEFHPDRFNAKRASEELLKVGLMSVIAQRHILRLSSPLNIKKKEIDAIMKKFRKANIS